MGNYTPGTIKARGGPPRGLIFNLRGYRVPWSLRRGLVADPRRCTPPRRIEFYGVFRDFVGSSTLFFYGCRICRFFACSPPVQPLFYGCRICCIFTGSPRVHALLLGVCFVRFVCCSCGFGAGSYDGAGRSCFHPKQKYFVPCRGRRSRFMRAARVANSPRSYKFIVSFSRLGLPGVRGGSALMIGGGSLRAAASFLRNKNLSCLAGGGGGR